MKATNRELALTVLNFVLDTYMESGHYSMSELVDEILSEMKEDIGYDYDVEEVIGSVSKEISNILNDK